MTPASGAWIKPTLPGIPMMMSQSFDVSTEAEAGILMRALVANAPAGDWFILCRDLPGDVDHELGICDVRRVSVKENIAFHVIAASRYIYVIPASALDQHDMAHAIITCHDSRTEAMYGLLFIPRGKTLEDVFPPGKFWSEEVEERVRFAVNEGACAALWFMEGGHLVLQSAESWRRDAP